MVLLTIGISDSLNINMGERFKLKVFMVDRFSVDGIKKGYTEYIPCRYSGIPDLFLKGRIPLDVALISLTPPDKNGVLQLRGFF